MTLVAISASYGALGSRIGPALAKRLEVPFIDRAIPLAVAERLDAPLDDATAHDENPGGSWLERILRGFIGSDTGAPTPLPPETFSSEDFRRATEAVLLRQAESGRGVILGRAAVIVLRENPAAFRVRLDGPPERRVRSAMRLQGIDQATAERAMRHVDRAHAEYARHFYGVDLNDPSLYHLVIDSTAIATDACVELIATAARALTGPGQLEVSMDGPDAEQRPAGSP
jgi:Cytidylate kinase-like family